MKPLTKKISKCAKAHLQQCRISNISQNDTLEPASKARIRGQKGDGRIEREKE